MSDIKKYFSIKEFVCKDVYKKFGDRAWDFLDERLLKVMLFMREKLNKPITINTWHIGGKFTQRGIRCNRCKLVKEKTYAYMSAHISGMAADFDVSGMTAQDVRDWLEKHKEELPYPIRVEDKVSWVHIDVRNKSMNKIEYFEG